MPLPKKEYPSKETLDALFSYDPENGILTWKGRPETSPEIKTWNKRFAGKRAGTLRSAGPLGSSGLAVKISREGFVVHRIIYLMQTGHLPDQVDHIDRNPLNNKWSNLRACSHSENMQNRGVRKDNKLKYPGVFRQYRSGAKPYRAQIQIDNRRISLGYSDTPEGAYALYVAAKASLHNFHPSAPR